MLANPLVHHNHPAPKVPLQRVTVTVQGIPSVSIQNNRLFVGSSQSSSTRSYTPVKLLGDGSFGTVWLCDWHGTLPPNTPLSPMQCGAGARAEWAGMRLVAVKRMKKRWEGGWDECQKLKELEVCIHAICVLFPINPPLVPPCNSISSKCYPSIRFFSSPRFQGALFRFRVYGRQPLSSYQG